MIFNNAVDSTNRIWAVFTEPTGELKTADTSAKISIYTGTGTAAVVSAADMTPLTGGTGLYHYAWNTTGLSGKYTGVMTFTDAGTIYNNTVDIAISSSNNCCDMPRYLTGGTFKVWNSYANSTGGQVDAGTMNVAIYPANNNTPLYADTVMTRHGTALYYHSTAIGTNGNYTAVFKGQTGTSIHGGIWQFSVANGTVDTTPPTRIGTAVFENGTSGTSAFIKFTPSNADGYNIYRSTSPFTTFTNIGASTGTYEDTGLNNNTEYQYYVVGTNSSGASLPSDIIYGFVYSDRFDYEKNTYEELQDEIEAHVSDIRIVRIGDYKILPHQLPACMIIPQSKEPDDNTTTGQFDVKTSAILRIYWAAVNKALDKPITDLMSFVGKVDNFLESIKGNQPYWYNSDVEEITYEKIDAEKQMKYTEIRWSAVRRLPRND